MKTATAKVPTELRKIGFAAPEQIHGVLKQVVGWAEMSEIRPSGVTFTEREFLQGLICGFWAKGQDEWAKELEQNAIALKKIAKPVARSN